MSTNLANKILNKFSRMSIAEKIYYGPKRNKYINKEFLLSDAYKSLMLRHSTNEKEFDNFINDAEEGTPNYQFRHSPHIQKQLGSWRWKAMYLYRKMLVPIIFADHAKGIDLGGAYGPVNKNDVIVDFAKTDIFGNPVHYKFLDEVDFLADFIYASHTLEHIPDLDNLAVQMNRVLKPGGKIIILIPSYSCVSWRVGNHTNLLHNDHVWTFCLAGTKITEPINNLFVIDTLLEKYFDVSLKEYTGDNSILIIAERK